MLLIYTQKITPRTTYAFKHICKRILGVEVGFTSVIEELIAHKGPKLSYGKQPMGNELFVQAQGLLTEQGVESIDITVKRWEDTVCFFPVSEKSALPFDIFSAAFYLMSRYEEYLPHVKDERGRYPVSESLGYKEKFLQQPVIDIWAYKFKKVLLEHFPHLRFASKTMDIHPVIKSVEPYAFEQKGFFRSLIGYLSDLLRFRLLQVTRRTQVLLGIRRDPNNTFKWLINKAKRSKKPMTFFFLLGEAATFKESINTHRQKFKLLIKYVNDYKEVGLLFSMGSLGAYAMLKKEKEQLEEITNRTLLSSMGSHYLVNLPDFYRNLVELEIKKDFTMVYKDLIGFRAGTCTPFLFYDLDYEIKTPLIVHPLAGTTLGFADKSDMEINKTLEAMLTSVKKVNGTFSLVFSNTDFAAGTNRIWKKIISEKMLQE
ncbi:polysaccharide deacetylase family protein [Marixanthomonas spongiae]|uniref:DUF7033 domain-containing protein n=1 Tax=Marixanthomonas spongiae TaxID=2174845 RepID=A0A2U0HWU0_9FLAO|nr:polysaccharide deacetylase family protein [Marixanthomonas spongiae]PVW13341.1 hypothetical protein DDV96_13315 [Marixanthomonas spongiae]